jgi:hypothetical protein
VIHGYTDHAQNMMEQTGMNDLAKKISSLSVTHKALKTIVVKRIGKSAMILQKTLLLMM